MQYASLSVTTLSTVSAHMQLSVLTRLSGHTVHPDKVCLTVSCVYTHPVQGLASLRTLDYNMGSVIDSGSFVCARESRNPAAATVLRRSVSSQYQ